MTKLIVTFRNSANALQMDVKKLQTSLPPLHKFFFIKTTTIWACCCSCQYRVSKFVFSKFVAVRNLATAVFPTGTNITDD